MASEVQQPMASFDLYPPAPFKPEECKKWRSRFDQYRITSRLSIESDKWVAYCTVWAKMQKLY